jgi:KDO2-lipid IV(A) lauroyltransferase
MRGVVTRPALTLRRALKAVVNAVAGRIVVTVMRVMRRVDRVRTARVLAGLMRRIGPWIPEHRTGRRNLAAAFPDKTPAEIEQILDGVWDNLGRVVAEFVHLDKLQFPRIDAPSIGDIVVEPEMVERFKAVRDGPKPTLCFAAHIANWELPAMAATHYGLASSVLYRPPNVRAVSDAVLKIRGDCMGTLVASGFDAPIKLAGALERGSHVGMLVDQHDQRGVDVTFFGRRCKASPFLAQLARHLECPIRGVRIIRLPDPNRFRGELTEPIEIPRDAEGRVDVAATMQVVTSIIEGWVREHPEQWLWLHRRWR